MRVWVAALLFAGSLLSVDAADQDTQCETPLEEADLKELIGAGVPAARLRQLITTCGIDLRLPDVPATESRLKEIGTPASALTALSPPPNPTAGLRWTSPFDRREMVFVAPGRFRMGSPSSEGGRDADEEVHDANVSAGFWVDTREVSNESYRRFLVARVEWRKGNVAGALQDANYLKDWTGLDYPAGLGHAPVSWVGWHAARAYAAWAGKRLPTEAEWEYAAGAGSSSAYWWGDRFDAARIAAARTFEGTDTERRTNPWGLTDMSGGVWEWTLSLYRPYPYASQDGREDIAAAGPRVLRGGSRANGEAFLRIANRNAEEPRASSDLVGFRCAR